MQLTRASQYAIHALAVLATAKTNQPAASHLVARERGIPERFLLKVLKPLVGVGILQSVKGPNGGYRLARPAREITVLEVIETVDGALNGQGTAYQESKHPALDKQLTQIFQRASEAARVQLGKVRLTDLVGKG
jgi:Rrf2 family protein